MYCVIYSQVIKSIITPSPNKIKTKYILSRQTFNYMGCKLLLLKLGNINVSEKLPLKFKTAIISEILSVNLM